MTPDLVVLGNLLTDDVVFPDGRTRMAEPGGATLYASLAASLWGLRTGVVSCLGDDYPAWALDAMRERGIDLAGVHPMGRPGVRTWLLYEGRRRRVVHRLDGPTHADASPGAAQIPEAWRGAPAFHLAPMPFEVQRDLVRSLSAGAGRFVSLDPYLLLTLDTVAAWREVIAGLDAFFLSEDEMELPGGRDDPRSTLRSLASGRLRFVTFKQGAAGGLLYDASEGRCLEWAPRATRVVDPTGAGDAFAGGFLAGCLRGEGIERALNRAVVSASFAMEDWGAAGLIAATPERAQARLAEWFGP